MRLFRVVVFCLVAGVPLLAVAQQAEGSKDEPDGVVDAFKQGTAHLSFRYRYEYIADDRIEKDAHASTLRTALSYRTAPLRGFEFFIEAENVAVLGDDWYRDVGQPPRGNGVTDRPVVADPAGTDLNQVMVRYRGFDTDVRVGRQEISIDDQRFVGPVGWRQHHQTFSAVNAANSSLGRLTLQYVFSNKVYRIFGDSLETANNFVHGSINAGGDRHKASCRGSQAVVFATGVTLRRGHRTELHRSFEPLQVGALRVFVAAEDQVVLAVTQASGADRNVAVVETVELHIGHIFRPEVEAHLADDQVEGLGLTTGRQQTIDVVETMSVIASPVGWLAADAKPALAMPTARIKMPTARAEGSAFMAAAPCWRVRWITYFTIKG